MGDMIELPKKPLSPKELGAMMADKYISPDGGPPETERFLKAVVALEKVDLDKVKPGFFARGLLDDGVQEFMLSDSGSELVLEYERCLTLAQQALQDAIRNKRSSFSEETRLRVQTWLQKAYLFSHLYAGVGDDLLPGGVENVRKRELKLYSDLKECLK